MRKKIVAGNWKMNLNKAEALALFTALEEAYSGENALCIVFPPAIYLDSLKQIQRKVALGVQNFYPVEKGAFTGEISVSQVKEMGAEYCLIGHSERRQYFHESDAFLKEKVDAALAHDLKIIFCCGEALEIREANAQNDFVTAQLKASLFHLSPTDFSKIVIAYEPIWAIGTGKTASKEQANEMHAHIRSVVEQGYGTEISAKTPLLYGGSCNPNNASELFACSDVDGGLIGGAALKASDFLTIVNA